MAVLGSEDECVMLKVVHETQYLDKMTWSLLFGKMKYGYWNSAFRWVYLSFSPLPLASLLFSAICKASSGNHFASFSWGWS